MVGMVIIEGLCYDSTVFIPCTHMIDDLDDNHIFETEKSALWSNTSQTDNVHLFFTCCI